MPTRPLTRDQAFLLPPRLDDLVPTDHPVRFVAAYVDALEPATWREWDMSGEGDPLGAPSYHPQLLLGVWLYGFMTRTRSSRGLERACREQIPLLWLTGCQYPDHNSLWRFYRDHREHLRAVFKRTVRTAVRLGLVDLALQAVDGTKVKANAARERTLNREGLERLMAQVEEAIAALEAQNVADEAPGVAALPAEMASAQALRTRVARALEQVQGEEGRRQANVTDPEAGLLRGRDGWVTGYNAQAMVSPLQAAGAGGLLITAVAVSAASHDQEQLLPMVAQAGENIGEPVATTLADGGYHSGENLRACAAQGYRVVMSESQSEALADPYHKDHFSHDAETDTYRCPQGQQLSYRGTTRGRKGVEVRVYCAPGSVCQACVAFGDCTRNRQGRKLTVGAYEPELRAHRAAMAEERAQAHYRRRQGIVEPVFGILKEVMGARGFLTRGLEKVAAEWCLLAAAFNLRSLWRLWARGALMLT